ncbi:MAG: sulfurtransferase-like selenium metabolism protein YedF [Oscillospiraceae bacterium]
MEMINVVGKPCPIPVIEAKKAIRKLAAQGGEVAVLVDNDIARQNLEKMATGMGHSITSAAQADGNILVNITVAAGVTSAEKGAGDTELIVAIGSNCMGKGEEELGKILMKSFIFSLTELDTPPEHILFYNSGAYLTGEDSTVLQDLQTLSAKGTLISTCGTCLNYYGIADKLAIGEVTNMYGITTVMAQGKKVINL